MDSVDKSLRVLVTGGFGYVGGRIAQFLSEMGFQVVLGSRKQHPPPEWLPRSKSIQLVWDDDDNLVCACKDVDVVIHSAGMNAQDCAIDPVAALQVNGLATARLVQASKKSAVSKFIYISTAHVYRSPLVGNVDENTCPRNLHPYATSHLAGENTVLHSSKNDNDFSGIVLRLSNVVGAPTSNNANCWMLFVNDLCKELIEHKSLTIRGNRYDVRDFISMSTVCKVCETVINDTENNLNGLHNVGSGDSLTLLQMANRIKERHEQIYNMSPEVISLTNTSGVNTSLNFDPGKLSFIVSDETDNSLNSEIDGLMRYCYSQFG